MAPFAMEEAAPGIWPVRFKSWVCNRVYSELTYHVCCGTGLVRRMSAVVETSPRRKVRVKSKLKIYNRAASEMVEHFLSRTLVDSKSHRQQLAWQVGRGASSTRRFGGAGVTFFQLRSVACYPVLIAHATFKFGNTF